MRVTTMYYFINLFNSHRNLIKLLLFRFSFVGKKTEIQRLRDLPRVTHLLSGTEFTPRVDGSVGWKGNP